MRIGYLTSQYPATSHTFIRREVEALRLRGVAIDTFSIRKPDAAEYGSEQDRAAFAETYYVLPVPLTRLFAAHLWAISSRPIAYFSVFGLALKHRAPGFKALVWALFHFAECIVLAREFSKRGIERVHNHFANAGANVGLLATQFLGLPWSLTLHGISETDYPAGLLLADKIRAAQFVACVSWFGQAQAMRITPPHHWHKFSIVRCGLSLSSLPERWPDKGLAGAQYRVICVGRLSSEKGHAGLLEAFADLRGRGIQANLVLVGDGPERDSLERQSIALGLTGAVSFKGRKDEQETLAEIARSDLLVLPSFMEGLPVVLMEAMALGVPVVASRVAGIPELIEDRKEGILFRPADWRALCDAMERILSDSVLAERIAKAARAKIEREFDIAVAVEPLLARFAGFGSSAAPPVMS